jgi:glucosamine--fructose-6-phosphate aminotransferase (isomerizing)
LRAVENFRTSGHGQVLTISCYPDSPLATAGNLNLVYPAGQEQSVAQTRSFSSLYTACTALAMIISGQEELLAQMSQLPAAGRRLLDRYAGLADDLGRSPRFDRFYFLGSAARYGLASEVSLKMKEMSLSHSEPFHFLEFRHGPMSMVSENALISGLVSDQNARPEKLVLEEMAAREAEILSLGEQGTRVSFESGLHPAIRNVLYLPILQLVAFEHSLVKGLNPDLPHNLTAVVRLT